MANTKTKAMPSPSKISVVNTFGSKIAVTFHRRAGMSPAKKQETPAKLRPPQQLWAEQKFHFAKRESVAKKMNKRKAKEDPMERHQGQG